MFHLIVGFFAVTDTLNANNEEDVFHGVDYAVVSYTYSVSVVGSLKFTGIIGSWFITQQFDCGEDTGNNLLIQSAQVFE